MTLDDCQDRHLYRVHGRNISLAVFRADGPFFIGIRTKFGDRFLDAEYPWESGPPFGTCKVIEELPKVLPEGIPNETSLSFL